jgi:TfoX/Sxy family transcriptional regulator of competence genes
VAYDEHLAGRVRELLAGRDGVAERKMFGGLAFMVRGNMCCGVHSEDLILRLSAEGGEDALAQPHVRPMDLTGRPMKGFVFVSSEGVRAESALRDWVERALAFNASLPAK